MFLARISQIQFAVTYVFSDRKQLQSTQTHNSFIFLRSKKNSTSPPMESTALDLLKLKQEVPQPQTTMSNRELTTHIAWYYYSDSFEYTKPDQLAEYLKCVVCYLPAYNAYYHSLCFKLVCFDCMPEEMVPIKHSGCSVQTGGNWYPVKNNPFCQELLNSLEIRCPRIRCTKVMKRGDLGKHFQSGECQGNSTQCEQCGQGVQRNDLQNHKEKECAYRILLCKYCGQAQAAHIIALHETDPTRCSVASSYYRAIAHPKVAQSLATVMEKAMQDTLIPTWKLVEEMKTTIDEMKTMIGNQEGQRKREREEEVKQVKRARTEVEGWEEEELEAELPHEYQAEEPEEEEEKEEGDEIISMEEEDIEDLEYTEKKAKKREYHNQKLERGQFNSISHLVACLLNETKEDIIVGKHRDWIYSYLYTLLNDAQKKTWNKIKQAKGESKFRAAFNRGMSSSRYRTHASTGIASLRGPLTRGI